MRAKRSFKLGWALALLGAPVIGCALGSSPTGLESQNQNGCDPSLDVCDNTTATYASGTDAHAPTSTHTPPKDGGALQNGGGYDAGNKPASKDSGGPGVDSGSSQATGECSGETTRTGCGSCCDSRHAAGLNVWIQSFGSCNCSSPGNCANACAGSYCNGVSPAPGSACDSCLNAQLMGQCGGVADNQCNGDATCMAWDACYGNSKCSTKL